MPKRSQSKNRSTSRGRPSTSGAKTPKSKSKSPIKKAQSAKKTPTAKKQQTSKSRSRSASRKVHTAPSAQIQRGPRDSAAMTPVARPSRSRSRTRTDAKSSAATATNTVTATSSHYDERPRRQIAGYGSEVASADARTARAVARSAQNAPWRVCGWVSSIKQTVVQKWRRSCLHRPSAAKVRRHFVHNGKWYISLIVIVLLAVLAYKFQRQLLVQVREVQTQLADFVETQRNIFGKRVTELQSALRQAKRKYLDQSTQTTGKPSIVSKVTVSPLDETYRLQQQNQQHKTVSA